MDIYTYTTVHRPEHPSAPPPVATAVATKRLTNPQPLVRTCLERDPGIVTGFSEHHLSFPEVQPGRAGVEQTASRYGACARCHLSERRTRVCHIKGNPNAVIAVVGEGPDKAEDTRGVPFCGPEGKLQDGLFRECGIDPLRDLAWLTLVGCRPCNNRFASTRKPTDVEKIACSERTTMLLQAIRPRVVLCLGDAAATMFWDSAPPPNTWHTLRPRGAPQDWIRVGVARHPGYLLRSVMSRYQEYFSARMFLLRLKEALPTLSHPSRWYPTLNYLKALDTPKVGI